MSFESDPARKGAAVTPSDSADIQTTRGLYVGAAGDIVVIFRNDTASVTLVAVAAGTTLPYAIKRVLSTGTTAASLVALY